MIAQRSTTLSPKRQALFEAAARAASEETAAERAEVAAGIQAREHRDYEDYLDMCSRWGVEPEYKTLERYKEAV